LTTQFQISGLDSYLDVSQFNYTWYLRNKFTALDLKIPNCVLNETIKSFSCDLNFLNQTNNETFEGYSKMITPTTMTISQLCDCRFESTYCLDNATLINGTCCSTSNTTINGTLLVNHTVCVSFQKTSCFSCELFPVVKVSSLLDPINEISLFESTKKFYFHSTRLF